MNLKGKVAWVTGGNSGIGHGVTKELVAAGAKVLITALNDEKGIQTVSEFGEENVMWVKADLRNRKELEAAAKKAVDRWGTIHLLFNAGGDHRGGGKFLTDDPKEIASLTEKMEDIWRINALGTFHVAQIAANYMKNNEPDENGERGSMIFVASIAADKVFYHWDDRVADTHYLYEYGMAKASILGLNRDLAVTLGHHGIRVNTIKPGYIVTPMAIAFGGVEKEVWPWRQLFPKVGGKPENIATMACELFRNPFITRAEITIDGGCVG